MLEFPESVEASFREEENYTDGWTYRESEGERERERQREGKGSWNLLQRYA